MVTLANSSGMAPRSIKKQTVRDDLQDGVIDLLCIHSRRDNGARLYLQRYLSGHRATLMPVLGLGWSAVVDYRDCWLLAYASACARGT